MFITLEGGDGSGKSTQARLIADMLRHAGRDVVLTREPGGSQGAEKIRALVLQDDTLSVESTLLLFAAARRDHIDNTIRPALDAGKVVICDRYVDSSRVYQGLDDVEMRGRIDALHALMIRLDPDLTLVFDIDGETADSRRVARNGAADRFESKASDFHDRVRQGFRDIARDYADRCVLIDAAGSVLEVRERVLAALPESLFQPADVEAPHP